MTTARKETVISGEEGSYHCVARCVRRAFLCGFDRYSGNDYEHRKEWMHKRIKYLSRVSAIDVAAYAVMSNHVHLVIRNRPDIQNSWTNEEVTKRWGMLYRRKRGSGAPRTKLSDERIRELRERLGSISWYMKSISEYIAVLANKEDECKGRFWEGRFKCQALLDESAELACMTYVDLNPVRARTSSAPEESRYTSGYDRIKSMQAKKKLAVAAVKKLTKAQQELIDKEKQNLKADKWLAPIGINYKKVNRKNKGILSISKEEYLELLDWTGRMVKSGKRGAIPEDMAPLFERLEIDAKNWDNTVLTFGTLFCRVAGKAERIRKAAQDAGKKWFKGINAGKRAFVQI